MATDEALPGARTSGGGSTSLRRAHRTAPLRHFPGRRRPPAPTRVGESREESPTRVRREATRAAVGGSGVGGEGCRERARGNELSSVDSPRETTATARDRVPGMRVGVLASGSGTILQALLGRQLPIVVGGRRPAVRRPRDRPRRTASRPSSSSAPTSARPSTASRTPTTSSTRSQRHDVDLVAIAGFGTILSKPFVDAFGGRAVNTHPGAAPVVQGLARGARRARSRGEGHRAAPCTSSPRTSTPARSSPRRRCPSSTTTPRRPCTNASRKSSAGSIPT